MISLLLTNIQDKEVRNAFESLRDTLNAQGLIIGDFRHFTLTTTGAVTNLVYEHNMGLVPKDVIVTRLSGGTVTWSYDSFTKDTVTLSTSGAVSLRFLLGRID